MGTIVITGANRGIGLELCRQYQQQSHEVIAVCRNSSSELDGRGIRVESGVDVASAEDVASLAKRLSDIDIDLLINNAGVLKRIGLEELDDDLEFAIIREQFEVNSLGPLRVTTALLPRIPPGGKIAIITSRMGSIGDNSSGSHYGYRMSKAAVNIAGVSLAHDLASRKIAVVILHPGFVRTGMTGLRGDVEPSHAAAGLIARIDELTLQRTGRFFHANGEELPW